MQQANMTHDAITISPVRAFARHDSCRHRGRAPDCCFPLFVAGAGSPPTTYSTWEWELCSLTFSVGTGSSCHPFLASWCPELDLVPLWTLAVANVYRKSKQLVVAQEGIREERPVREDPRGM